MNIVHLCTSDSGGAGTAAYRQHSALLHEPHLSSEMLVATQQRAGAIGVSADKKMLPRFYERYLRRLGLTLSKVTRKQKQVAKLGGKYEIYSLPFSTSNPENHPLVKGADILNLHWVSGFIDYTRFFKATRKPLVWTLHDMHPFLGGFHYREDHVINGQAFADIEKQVLEVKKRAIDAVENLTIVAPSQWLLNESANSDLLGRFKHVHIPYSLPLDDFKPQDKSFSRDVFGLPKNKRVVLFVSQSINNKRKGFHVIAPILSRLKEDRDIICAAVGNVKNNLPDNVYSLGSIQDHRLLSMAYSAADLFIMPSLEDNLPNVMLESLACGTPVLAGNYGGMKDTIKDGFNGMLLNGTKSEDYFNAIVHILDNLESFKRQDIRQDAVDRFHPKVQAQRYKNLYQQLI